MAKKSLIEREIKRKKLVKKYALQRTELKIQIKKTANFSEKFEIQQQLQKLPLNSSPTRLHNRCSKTGRPKGYYRFFGLSRHVIRTLAHEGVLPGVRKASW